MWLKIPMGTSSKRLQRKSVTRLHPKTRTTDRDGKLHDVVYGGNCSNWMTHRETRSGTSGTDEPLAIADFERNRLWVLKKSRRLAG
jgi:hypothetical protein